MKTHLAVSEIIDKKDQNIMPLEAPLSSVHTRATPGPAPGGLGRGLFASTTIKVGEDVLNITSPFVAVLDTPRLSDTCSGCLGSGPLHHSGPLKNCTGCKVVKYCDRVYTPRHTLSNQHQSLTSILGMSKKGLEVCPRARVRNLQESKPSYFAEQCSSSSTHDRAHWT